MSKARPDTDMQSAIEGLRQAVNQSNIATATLTASMNTAAENIRTLFSNLGEFKNEYTPRREHDQLSVKVDAISKKLDEVASKMAMYAGALGLLATMMPIITKLVFKV